MNTIRVFLFAYTLTLICSVSFAYVITEELNSSGVPADSVFLKWRTTGCDSISHPIREIDVTNIPPIVCLNLATATVDTTYFNSAIPDDNTDDSSCFQSLIDFLQLRDLNLTEHIRIHIPPGDYNFSDGIIMQSNISLKGAGSNSTCFLFDIRDTLNNTMTLDHYKSNCIEICNYVSNIGIEDINISRSQYNANFVSAFFDSLTIYVETNIHSAYHSEPSFHGNNAAGGMLVRLAIQITRFEKSFPDKRHVTSFVNHLRELTSNPLLRERSAISPFGGL